MHENTAIMGKKDVYAIVTDRIIALLEQGTIPWKQTWTASGIPMNFVSKRPYTGINVWLLLSLGYRKNLFLTWDQLRKLGWNVKRGERGQVVIFYKQRKVVDEKTEKEHTLYMLRYYTVFNIEQCEGVPERILDQGIKAEPVALPSCERIVSGMPNAPKVLHQVERACYIVTSDTVNMPKPDAYINSDAYYADLFHELVHSTGHPSRLNRPSLIDSEKRGDEQYALEELVAEMGASYLCFVSGISASTIENSAAYIENWLTKLRNDRKYVIQAASLAQQAVDFICRTHVFQEA